MSVQKWLEELEARTSDANSEWVIPIEVRILAKAAERRQARNDGREPPPYAQQEIEQIRRYDLEIAAGGGVVGQVQDSVGWQIRRGPRASGRLGERRPQETRASKESTRPSDGARCGE